MRLERLTYNKIKIFLTLDDLSERGLTKEDIWKDSLKWQQLFHDMLDKASDELGLQIQGSIAVEIFSMQAQGMIMVVTVEEDSEDEELFQDGFIEMSVTMGNSEEILFEFKEFEDVIQLAKRLASLNIKNGSLYAYKGQYYLHLPNINADRINKIVANLAEYGNPSMLSIHMLIEYGKAVIKEEAVEKLTHFFH